MKIAHPYRQIDTMVAANVVGSSKDEGFTLIELLVVIAIIGMLASIILASLSGARASARDAQRKEEAKAMQTALELYYTGHGHYPCADSACDTGVNPLISSSVAGSALIADQDMSSIPADPTYAGACNSTTEGYCYCSKGDDSYALTVHLETAGGGKSCYIDFGPNASSLCTGHQPPGTWAPQDCTSVF